MNCSIDNCNEKVYARGWCRKHYRHVVEGKHLEPLPVPPSNCTCGKSISNRAASSGLCYDCYQEQWYNSNLKQQQLYSKQYRTTHKKQIRDSIKKWRANNKEKEKIYYKEKRKQPIYKISHNLRSIIYDHLKGRIKHKNTEQLTGCSFSELIIFIENKFQQKMSWDNYGSYWVIDHIKPLCSFDLLIPEELEKACHYTNLRPLSITENASKATEDKKWKKS